MEKVITRIRFVMRLKHTLIWFFILISVHTFGINDISKLSETIKEYADTYITKQSEINQTFVLSFNEFKKLADDIQDTTELRKQYIHYTSKIKRLYLSASQSGKEISKLLSFDTLTFRQDNYTFMSVCLVFETTGTNGKDNNTKRILSSFIVWGTTLKLAPTIRALTKSEFLRQEFTDIYKNRNIICTERFSTVLFTDTIPYVIPFKKSGLWGLQDKNGKVLVKPLYDSIYPFKNGYSLVVKGKTYNLIDESNFALLFKEWKSKIRYSEESDLSDFEPGKGVYFVTNADKSIIKVGNIKDQEVSVVQDENDIDNFPKNTITPITDNFYAPQHIVIDKIYRQNEVLYNLINTKENKVISNYKNYDYLETFGKFFIGQRNDTTFVIDTTGTIIFKTLYSIKAEYPGYIILLDRNTRMFGMYCPYTKLYIAPQYYYIQAVKRDSFFIVLTNKVQLGYLNRKGEKLFE